VSGSTRQEPGMDRANCRGREALRHRPRDVLVHAHGSRPAVDPADRMAAV